MIRRLTSAPKPAARVSSYIAGLTSVAACGRALRAEAVADTVVAREVRTRLRGGDQVVDRDAEPRVRQVDRRRASRPAPATRRGRRARPPDLGVDPVSQSRPDDRRSAGRARRPSARPRSRARARRDAVESSGSAPAMTPSTQRSVARRRRERADLIERRGERDQAVARHAAVGRLQADHAAERRGLANRAAGVRAQRHRRQARGHGDGRPAARPPGRPVKRPRVARRAERRVLGRRAHRELVAVRLADDDGAGLLEARRRRSRRRAGRTLEDPRPGGRPQPARADVVLDGDGHAEQRRGSRPASGGIERAARASARSASTVQKRAEAGIAPSIRSRQARHTSTAETRAGRRGRRARSAVAGEERHPPITRGTLNRPATDRLGRVASASARSQRRPRRRPRARRDEASSTCDVGGTPRVSTAATCRA